MKKKRTTARGAASIEPAFSQAARVCIIADPADPVAGSLPARWAAKELEAALAESLTYYRNARAFWAELADRAKSVYKPDIAIGEYPVIRGHWADRLPAIDEDIAFMAGVPARTVSSGAAQQENVRHAINEAKARPMRADSTCRHGKPEGFEHGKPLGIDVYCAKTPASVRIYYRHVNHAERFEKVEMRRKGKKFHALIPAAYTDTVYPIQYYFELIGGPEKAWLYPGLGKDLTTQPYFVLRKQ